MYKTLVYLLIELTKIVNINFIIATFWCFYNIWETVFMMDNDTVLYIYIYI